MSPEVRKHPAIHFPSFPETEVPSNGLARAALQGQSTAIGSRTIAVLPRPAELLFLELGGWYERLILSEQVCPHEQYSDRISWNCLS